MSVYCKLAKYAEYQCVCTYILSFYNNRPFCNEVISLIRPLSLQHQHSV